MNHTKAVRITLAAIFLVLALTGGWYVHEKPMIDNNGGIGGYISCTEKGLCNDPLPRCFDTDASLCTDDNGHEQLRGNPFGPTH